MYVIIIIIQFSVSNSMADNDMDDEDKATPTGML